MQLLYFSLDYGLQGVYNILIENIPVIEEKIAKGALLMPDKNIEMMKKFLEEKKKKAAADSVARPNKKIGSTQKGFNSKKTGGALNK